MGQEAAVGLEGMDEAKTLEGWGVPVGRSQQVEHSSVGSGPRAASSSAVLHGIRNGLRTLFLLLASSFYRWLSTAHGCFSIQGLGR